MPHPHISHTLKLSLNTQKTWCILTEPPVLQWHSTDKSHDLSIISSSPDFACYTGMRNTVSTQYYTFQYNISLNKWIRTIIKTSCAMKITITLQISWNATTSFMNPTEILHAHVRIGTNSLFANTTWIFFRIFNLTLVQLTFHYLLFSVFTSWPFISIPFFHLFNFTAAKPLFLQTEHNYQHQVVPWTSLFWFLYKQCLQDNNE